MARDYNLMTPAEWERLEARIEKSGKIAARQFWERKHTKAVLGDDIKAMRKSLAHLKAVDAYGTNPLFG